MTSVDSIWRRLDAHLLTVDGANSEMGPPASDAKLALCEAALSVTLPSAFRESLRCHDGVGRILFLVGSYRLWPIDEIVRLNQRMRSLHIKNEFCSGDKSGHVKDLLDNPLWILFGDDGGTSTLAVDLDPGEKGTPGQIIEQFEDETVVLANGILEFLERVVTEIESGDRVWDAEAGGWSTI